MHTTIAEVGVNHNHDLERALEMIDVAADAGAERTCAGSLLL